MKQIKSKDTKPELIVRSLLHKNGYRFSLHKSNLPGKPDIVLPKYKTVIFIHGCFWHQHKNCKRANIPKSNQKYWIPKLERNRLNDKKHVKDLRKLRWKIIIIWECWTKDLNKVESIINRKLMVRWNKMKKSNSYSVISLFSGCGGMDLGTEGGFKFLKKNYKKTGFKIIWANDIDKDACATLQLNFPNTTIARGDIREITLESLPKKCDLIIGGFPCQDFSITRSTKREGIKVKRGKLYEFFVKTVKEKNPKAFIAENVKGILSANNGEAIKLIIQEFAKINIGYNIHCDLYKFVEYGVPQYRERVLIIGIRNDINYIYKKPKPLDRFTTAGEAFSGIRSNMPNHNYMNIQKRTIQILSAIPPGKNVAYLKDHPKYRHLYVKGLMSNIYRRLERNKPSSTIIAGGGGGTWGYHFSEPRALTNRERASIQSFPYNFEFAGTNTEVRRQIGNAVPPVGIHPVAMELQHVMKASKRKPGDVVEINIRGIVEKYKL